MKKESKSDATSGTSRSKAVVEEKGKRSQFRTRVGMNFDPRTTKLHDQAYVDEYRVKYCVCLSPRSRSNSTPRILSS